MKEDHFPTDLLKNKVILVTGAGSGIGKATSIAYAQHGATVLLLGRSDKNLEETYDCIKAKNLPEPCIFTLDLANTQYKFYTHLAEKIEQEFGHLDGLLHNAGALGQLGPISQYPVDTWCQTMQVNVHAQFLLTRSLLPLLRSEERHTSILFTTSNLGCKGRAHWGAYSVSKFATEGLAQVLADEEKDVSKLRINLINPGRIRTTMRAKAYPAEDPEQLDRPEDIVAPYIYLMSDQSCSLNGERINAQEWVLPCPA